MIDINSDLKDRDVYVLELEQPYVNYYAKVIEEGGKMLTVRIYLPNGEEGREITIMRSQVAEVIE
jgi:hypothetical protein